MRIRLKTITPENDDISYQDVGFVALRSLLLKKSPLLGLSLEVDDAGTVTATHHLYNLAQDENGVEWIERHPLRRLVNTVTVMKPCERSKAITDPFTPSGENVIDTIPTIPNNADQCFFSEAEKKVVLSPLHNCFSRNGVDVFSGKDPLVVRSILETLLSAGFMSHPAWQSNLTLLSENKNKLTEIAHALFALHEVGLLTQTTFTAVVHHATPWECASALRYLTHKYPHLMAVPFIKARHVDDDLFRVFSPTTRTTYTYFVTTIVNHPCPEEISRIIALLYHCFKSKLDLSIVDAVAGITDKLVLNYLGPILSHMHQKHLINKENCLILLQQPLKLKSIYVVVNHQLELRSRLALTQPLFDCIIAFDHDPQILVAKLSKQANPVLSVELFAHLVKAQIGTDKNLDVFCKHKNSQVLEGLLKEVVTAGVTITQTIFDALCAYQEPTNKSVVEILASTCPGRDVLRNHLKIESEKFLFGSTEISPESLKPQVDGKSIREWLSMTTAMEFEEKAFAIIDTTEAKIARDAPAIILKKQALLDQFMRNQSRLFSLRCVHGVPAPVAATGERRHSEAVTPVLQQVVYGNECDKTDSVQTTLDAAETELNRNKDKLLTLLCDVSTVTDYSGRQITDTLLKAALRAGDVAMCQMLIPYFDLIPGGKEELEIQFLEVFPDGVEAAYNTLEEDSKWNFEPMLQTTLQAILAEPNPNPSNLNATLNKQVDNILYQTLENSFRKPFENLSNCEKTFNPYHLLRAFEVYNELWDQCERDKSDPDCKKRDLFWRQIVGYTQRFMPACYAQAFAQSLYCLVKVDQVASWRPEPFNRALKLRHDNFSYYPLPVVPRSGLGFDFAIFAGQRALRDYTALLLICTPRGAVFQKFLLGKNRKLSEHYAASSSAARAASLTALTHESLKNA